MSKKQHRKRGTRARQPAPTSADCPAAEDETGAGHGPVDRPRIPVVGIQEVGVVDQLEDTREDLQVTIEELKTSNAKLSTVNAELQSNLHDLETANGDILHLLSSTDIAMLFLGTDLSIKSFTPPTARLLSLRTTDTGRPIADFAAGIAGEGLIPDARRVLGGLTPITQEVWSAEPGSRCYLRRTAPCKTADQRIEGVVITFVDITVAKRGQEVLERAVDQRTLELVESRRKLQSVVDNALDGIIAIDGQGVVELFNPPAERMFGYRAAEVVGQNVRMLMPPPYRDEHDGYLRAYLQTGEAKIIGAARNLTGRRKDGSEFPLQLAVSVVHDGVPRFVATLHDLTTAEAAEAALRREHALSEAIVSTAQVIILRLDVHGRVVSFNPYMERLSGYLLEEVEGKDWFDTFIPARDRPRIRGLFAQAVAGHPTQDNIHPIVTRSGQERLIEWCAARLQLPGQPVTLLSVGQDVTAHERLEREFLQAQKMEAVGRLAGGVAHDFNNLLAGVTSGLRIAAGQVEEGHRVHDLLRQVLDELERGATMTRHLLDFSRTENPDLGPIEPCRIIVSAEVMIRRLLGEDIDVRLVCDQRHTLVIADPGQLEQSLLNLAVNARDAMPRGGALVIECAELELSAGDVEELGAALEPGPYFVLTVRDTGCGMDQQTLKRSVESFFTTKPAGQGTGLGLSSIAARMKACGGHLALESEPGVGTTARLYFPVVTGAATVETATGASLPCEGGGETILVVEDEKLVRMGVEHILADLGYVVLSAADPEAALRELERDDVSVDLLLTDVVLPRLSGPALAASVAATHPDLRVLYMSAYPAEELVAQGRIAKGTKTIEKPFTAELVARAVRQALRPAKRASGS